MTKKILVLSDGKRGPGATQKISFGQPFEATGGNPEPTVVFERDISDPAQIAQAFEMHRPDAIILSRYHSESGMEWIGAARGAAIPIIFHIDDDLLAVPESLGAAKYGTYNKPERLRALRRNIESSDVLYVSTTELGKRFAEHGVTIPIIAGDIYCSVSQDDVGALAGPATGPLFGYMGTSGHFADLAMILPAISEVMDAVPSLQFELFGTIEMPSELARFGRRVRHLPPVTEYARFIPFLRSLGWWIGLAPLEDNPFNRCKADTKWVEYSLAGIAVIASDLPVYQRACADGAGVLAGTGSAWTESLLDLLHRPALRETIVSAAQAKLRESYTHDRLRRQVERVLSEAASLSAGRTPSREHASS